MKRVKVQYIATGKIQYGLLIETVAGLDEAIEQGELHKFSRPGVLKAINENKPVYVNSSGGWCPAEGTWNIIQTIS